MYCWPILKNYPKFFGMKKTTSFKLSKKNLNEAKLDFTSFANESPLPLVPTMANGFKKEKKKKIET